MIPQMVEPVIVGVSYSHRNSEYIYTKLTEKLEKDSSYIVQIRFKILSSAELGLECLSFALVKDAFKSRDVKNGQVYCVPLRNWTNALDTWLEIETPVIGKGERFLVLGPFLPEQCYLTASGNIAHPDNKSIVLLFDRVSIFFSF